MSFEAVTTNAIIRGLTLYCFDQGFPYDIQLWYTTVDFTAAVDAEVRDSNNGWVQATTSGSITGTCPSARAPVPITGLNIPLTLGIKTGLSAVDTMGEDDGAWIAYYTTADANDVRPITSTDGRIVNYYASGGADESEGSPGTILFFPSTPGLQQLVIEFPST